MAVVPHMTTLVRKLVKWFYILVAIAVISLAVVVQAGRSFSHLLAKYPNELSNYLSHQSNAKVSIGALSAEWNGLKPMVDVRDLRITSQSDQPIIALSHAQMRLDLLDSLLHLRLVWSSLTLTQVDMDFIQSADGFWRIPGIPRKKDKTPGQEYAQLDGLIDMALLSGRIEFQQSQLNFKFASGDKISLNSSLVRMENVGKFHRLSLQVDVDNHPKALTLVVEGNGDPRKKESFSSKGFVQLKQFPTSEPIAAVTAFLLHGINAEVHSEGSLDASLWFNSRPRYEGFDLVGRVGIQRLSLPVMTRKLMLDSFSSKLVGFWLYDGQWQIALQNIGADINQNHIENINFAASSTGFEAPVVLHMQKLDVKHLNEALDGAGVFGEAHLRDVMRQLAPSGELRNVQVAIPISNPKDWQLKANAVQLAANAWQGVPALSKVDGFVQAGQHGGFVDIDSRKGFSMHYHPTYDAPMEYQEAKGQVAWWLQPENNQIYVNSGALQFKNGNETAKGYMWLALPWTHNTGDTDLYLQIGAKQLDASLYKKYTPAVVPHSLLTWLEKSIGPNNAGLVNQVGFVYRGTLNNHNHAARTHQLYVDMNHAQLHYHPEWPMLNEINGRLLVSDEDIDASVDSAQLFSSTVNNAEITVRKNSEGHGSLLRVDGSVSGTASDGLRVLRESMLRRYIGANMDSWKLQGNMQTRVNIAVPLEADAPGSAQQIDIDLSAPYFEMGNLKLNMRDIKGRISYNQDSGISSEGLQTTLFDAPVRVLLSTKKQNDFSQTLVDVDGDVESKALALWSQRPEALFLQGNIPYHAHIELNHRAQAKTTSVIDDIANTSFSSARLAADPFAVVTVTSQLLGISVDLPHPYGKTLGTERPLIFKMSLRDHSSLIDVSYGDNLQALFELDPASNKLRNANIGLDVKAHLPEAPQFLVEGKLPTFDIDPWAKVQQRYLGYIDQLTVNVVKSTELNPQPDDGLVAGLPFRAKLQLDHYQVGPLRLENIDVNAERMPDAWKVAFSNPVVVGDIYLPNEKAKPLQINLQSLHLTRDILEGKATDATSSGAKSSDAKTADTNATNEKPLNEQMANEKPSVSDFVALPKLTEPSQLAQSTAPPLIAKPNTDKKIVEEKLSGPTVDPRTLPFANITVKALYLDDINYGNWSLQIRPNENGTLFDNIHGTVRGITVGGADDELAGAKLNWQLSESGPRTHFIGSLSATDLGSVLQQWQKPDTIGSNNAHFRTDVSWAGDPQDFAFKNLTGSMNIWVEKGRFKRNPSVGSDGFLRLMAILNFDSLARRLRLDFSDLYQSGLAFDQITGKVTFEPGTMTFIEPLVVKTPSSRLQMAGTLDLEREKINTRLVATLPVAGNLTFLAALATGLPAAAGIYVISKLFKKQVDQATSVSYRIHGGWDDPTMSFDRLFESEEKLIENANTQEDPASRIKKNLKRKPSVRSKEDATPAK